MLIALVTLATFGALLGIRAQTSAASDDLDRIAAQVGALPQKPTPADIQAFMATIPVPATLTGRFGQQVARTGSDELWSRGATDWIGGLAHVGAATRVFRGAVDVSRGLPFERNLALRRDLGNAATTISGLTALLVGAGALLLALLAGLLSLIVSRRGSTRMAGVVAMAESMASGRPMTTMPALPSSGDFGRVGAALQTSAERLMHLGDVADREVEVLGAAIEPLPIAVSGRGPTGVGLRNVALERLMEGVGAEDRAQLDVAIKEGLDGDGPVSTRVGLRDGRLFDVDGWSVPGGRLVSVAEGTEQERLAHLRRQLESSAVRQLRAPIDEINARSRELYQQVPASGASKLRAIFAATDRLDRVVRMLLRGTPHDPSLRPPRRETFGVAGLLWGLVHDWDSALRQRALRVELDVASELPDVRTDPALVEEILTELVDNAAKYTPRGGTVALSARPGEGSVVIEVADTGTGFRDEDVPHATERFFRGQYAESIPGAGLGLGVASALAERLGGTLVIQTGPGGKVRLELPAHVAPPAAELAGV